MGCGSSVPAAADGNTVQITKINDAESAYDAADKTVTKMKATAGMRIRKVTNYHMKKFAEWDDETFDVVINRLMLKFKRYSRASARMSAA